MNCSRTPWPISPAPLRDISWYFWVEAPVSSPQSKCIPGSRQPAKDPLDRQKTKAKRD